jgi:hypothetical protein
MTSNCVKMTDGSEVWMKDRKLHREDGPAIYRARDKFIAYYLDGKEVSYKNWLFKAGQYHMTPKQLTFMLIKYGLKE